MEHKVYVISKSYAYKNPDNISASRFKKEQFCLHTIYDNNLTWNDAKKKSIKDHIKYFPDDPYGSHGICPEGKSIDK
jgi:hypothetical protein